MTQNLQNRTSIIAQFSTCLNLQKGLENSLNEAAEEVGKEYRKSVRWKRLRCEGVKPLTAHPGNTIFILEVGHIVAFDWTWEGALAFRPINVKNFSGDFETTGDGPICVWFGEVVEVDETNGRIFVSVSNPDYTPGTGTFFVRPFGFLAALHSLYCLPECSAIRKFLPSRLQASCGNDYPLVLENSSPADAVLAKLWCHAWGILWGPPGTGKTYFLGRQVAACLKDPSERILVISTTNKATDAAAFAIGQAASAHQIDEGNILRIGKGATWDEYHQRNLTGLLRGTETDLLRQLGDKKRELKQAITHEEKAKIREQIKDLERTIKDNSFNIFADPRVKTVICTAFKAMLLLNDEVFRNIVAAGKSPFTTIVIDEASLMSRAAVAVLSLLAARRVILVGDAKQLAPISKAIRMLSSKQATWLASSCLSHLQSVDHVKPGVHLLRRQYRMHPDISRVISNYQYEGSLEDAPEVLTRKSTLSPLLANQPRAIWYVLDEDTDDLPMIRSDRGPGNQSYVRRCTKLILEKLFADTPIYESKGLFITPFRAQAKDISEHFVKEKLPEWSAGTVHANQGIEADVVIFDSVNAGCGWNEDEWKRLVNVGLSRGREFIILLASRAEMNQPFLQPLLKLLAPRILKRTGRNVCWETVPVQAQIVIDVLNREDPNLLGNQIEQRKAIRPIMSQEQQQICQLKPDGKPRLVRGVAGSGKTFILANWLQKTVKNILKKPNCVIWAVYANKALWQLIRQSIDEAWEAEQKLPFPWERAKLLHVGDLLDALLPQVGIYTRKEDKTQKKDKTQFDYDLRAKGYLERMPVESIVPLCDAMFIDEAQDMGPNMLKLLTAHVKQNDPKDPNSRGIYIFYDNAQNIYGRDTPRWVEMGINMQGRSEVMKESFRSTRPIVELAFNVLYLLKPSDSDPDHKELIKRGLIEQAKRNENSWWNVRFNQVDGPIPTFQLVDNLDDQVTRIGKQIRHWIRNELVKPKDICILYNGNKTLDCLNEHLPRILAKINVRLFDTKIEGQTCDDGSVRVSTTHSFKGYEAEIIVIAGVEGFVTKEGDILAKTLYVAMTQARSILAIYATPKKKCKDTERLLTTIQERLTCLTECLEVEPEDNPSENGLEPNLPN